MYCGSGWCVELVDSSDGGEVWEGLKRVESPREDPDDVDVDDMLFLRSQLQTTHSSSSTIPRSSRG